MDHLRRTSAVPGVEENVVACQLEYSPFELKLENNGFLAIARGLGVANVAYSPLGRGEPLYLASPLLIIGTTWVP